MSVGDKIIEAAAAAMGKDEDEVRATLGADKVDTGDDSGDKSKSRKQRPTGRGDKCDKRDKSIGEILQGLLVDESAELWTDHEHRAYVTLWNAAHCEHYPLRSQHVARHLRWLLHYGLKKPIPLGEQALETATCHLEMVAQYEGATYPAFHRYALSESGAIWIDLANKSWEAVEVWAEGYRISAQPRVRFIRSPGMAKLPKPTLDGGSVDLLRRVVKVETEEDFKLLVAWVLSAMVPKDYGVPYPVMAIESRQGSGKSTTGEILQALVDPSTVKLGSLPAKEDDLFVAAARSHLLTYDNVSKISDAVGDAMCKIATGGAHRKRTLYTDGDETILVARNPQLVTGITGVHDAAGDLVDRCVQIMLPAIAPHERRLKSEIMATLTEIHPKVFGGLCDALSCALRRVADVQKKMDRVERMADFQAWVTAAEPALGWASGDFARAYAGSRENALFEQLANDPVIHGLLAYMEGGSHRSVTMNASKWLQELKSIPTADANDEWPKTANAMGSRFKRIAPVLTDLGWDLRRGSGRQRREWTCTRAPQGSSHLSQPSPTPPS